MSHFHSNLCKLKLFLMPILFIYSLNFHRSATIFFRALVQCVICLVLSLSSPSPTFSSTMTWFCPRLFQAIVSVIFFATIQTDQYFKPTGDRNPMGGMRARVCLKNGWICDRDIHSISVLIEFKRRRRKDT